MAFDADYMERSKGFVKALQELKNLRSQLYSAAEYCENSYHVSDEKQTVFDNLKDYSLQSLVNAVDHLGTVAYKLTNLLDQQTIDISSTDLKVVSLNQQLLTCQTYMGKEGIKQHELLAFIPKHSKHYILPNFVNKKVHFSPYVKTESRQSYIPEIPHFQQTDTPASKTLSWHLASGTNTTLKDSSLDTMSSDNEKTSFKTSGVFHLSGAQENIPTKLLVSHHQLRANKMIPQTFGVIRTDISGGSKQLKSFKSLDRPHMHGMGRPRIRSISKLSSFFVKKHKSPKMISH